MKSVRTSVDVPDDLYRAFKQMGGTLSIVVREAIRDYLGIKGASEDALAVMELKYERMNEERIRHENKAQEINGQMAAIELQMKQIKSRISEKALVDEQARIMRESVNPYIRAKGYKVDSITPELHEMLLQLKEAGVTHDLESLQKWAVKLDNADYLKGDYRESL
jgi:hypothetical protein